MTEARPTEALETAADQLGLLLGSARRRIWLQTRCRVLNSLPDLELGTHLSRIARRTRHPDIRLLIDDDLELKATQPRLARAVTRLTTAVEVRCFTPEQDTPGTLLLVVDRGSWLYLVQHRSQIGLRTEHADPAGTHSAAQRFLEAWALASESLELRRLTL